MEGALSNLRQSSTQWEKWRSSFAVSLLRMFLTFSVVRCHITFSKPMRLPSRYHAKGPIGAEAFNLRCRFMEVNSAIYAIAMNIQILISKSFSFIRFSACKIVIDSFHAIYVIFIEAGRFLYPGHEVGQFDDEKRDQMDMAHLACLSWKAACFWHLKLDLARCVSWK